MIPTVHFVLVRKAVAIHYFVEAFSGSADAKIHISYIQTNCFKLLEVEYVLVNYVENLIGGNLGGNQRLHLAIGEGEV